jgi:corrinoid protein of di/trimethylamine methyltransferase
MSRKEEILNRLKISVETWNIELARFAAKQAVEQGIDPSEAIVKGLGEGMVSISERFDEAKIYLPQVLAASKAMEAALEVFAPQMEGISVMTKGTIVIGTVQGDVHEIGRHVVCAFLRGARYNVIDLGRDVPTERFIEAAIKFKADVVGASALMTTTMPCQAQIVELIKEAGLTDIKTIFGGAPCTQKWVDHIGGDAFCPSGGEVVATVEKLLKKVKD